MLGNHFNLKPPPNFQGLRPDLSVTVYHRHLPHWRQEGATYFVTFRLADSLPQKKLAFLQRLRVEWELTHPQPRSEQDWIDYTRDFAQYVNRWLDEGYGECYFRTRRWSDDLKERLFHFQDERYQLFTWAIMPNHCHLIIRPFPRFTVENLVGSIKGVSARNINVALGRTGSLWGDESYDRIVRDEEHLWRVVQYIGRNPSMAGLQHEESW